MEKLSGGVRVHGFERTRELQDALAVPAFAPTAAIRDGRLVAYAATLTFFPAAHAVAETQNDMAALIAGTLGVTDKPGSFLLPTRQAELFRDRYETPAGSWIPSVLY